MKIRVKAGSRRINVTLSGEGDNNITLSALKQEIASQLQMYIYWT